MTSFPRSAYGTVNPNAGRPPNGDAAAWGGWRWPNCPPSNLLGTTSYVSRSANGQTIRTTVRRELVPLWNLLFEIADRIHGYPTWSNRNGENWGPWGNQCRAVAGTNTPSGHSMALAVDINAPNNPMSTRWQSDMPPAMVAHYESCGMFWGGRFTGTFDPMHYAYCFPPSSVAGHIARAQQILGGTPQPPGEDWFDMATEEDLRRVVAAELDARSLTPQGINDLVANVCRADEFRLDRDRRQQDQFNTNTEWARSDEFALGLQRQDVVAIKAKLDA